MRPDYSNTVCLSGAVLIANGKWHQVVLTRGEGDTWRLYVDGELDAAATKGPGRITANTMMIGAVSGTTTTATKYFEGLIDEAALYARALTATEVSDHYAAAEREKGA